MGAEDVQAETAKHDKEKKQDKKTKKKGDIVKKTITQIQQFIEFRRQLGRHSLVLFLDR